MRQAGPTPPLITNSDALLVNGALPTSGPAPTGGAVSSAIYARFHKIPPSTPSQRQLNMRSDDCSGMKGQVRRSALRACNSRIGRANQEDQLRHFGRHSRAKVMVQKAGAAYADSKSVFFWRHKLLRRFNGRLSIRAAMISILVISLAMWVAIIKVGELIFG